MTTSPTEDECIVTCFARPHPDFQLSPASLFFPQAMIERGKTKRFIAEPPQVALLGGYAIVSKPFLIMDVIAGHCCQTLNYGGGARVVAFGEVRLGNLLSVLVKNAASEPVLPDISRERRAENSIVIPTPSTYREFHERVRGIIETEAPGVDFVTDYTAGMHTDPFHLWLDFGDDVHMQLDWQSETGENLEPKLRAILSLGLERVGRQTVSRGGKGKP